MTADDDSIEDVESRRDDDRVDILDNEEQLRQAIIVIRSEMTTSSLPYNRAIDLAMGDIESLLGLAVTTIPLAHLQAMGHTFRI